MQKDIPADYRKNLTAAQMGFEPAEHDVMAYLLLAWNAFNELPRDHPDEMRQFRDGFHQLQSTLAMRVIRRDHPEGWYSQRKTTEFEHLSISDEEKARNEAVLRDSDLFVGTPAEAMARNCEHDWHSFSGFPAACSRCGIPRPKS